MEAKKRWEQTQFHERASVFWKAAELLTTKYRYEMLAATMLGQGKTVWQAEIDCIAELADFWRLGCKFGEQILQQQPEMHARGIWNRMDYRPLDGFVAAIGPFNFTAIGGNLASAPALMGNSVLWKPSSSAVYSNYLAYKILEEAGLPPGVVQFVPADAKLFSNTVLSHPEFGGIHFTGSSDVLQLLWKQIATNLPKYRAFPRIVGETGGKNMHFVHPTANVVSTVHHTIRAAFEYQGQKCSACSRLYLPKSLEKEFITRLVEEVKQIKVGHVKEFKNFMSAVVNQAAFDKINGYIKRASEDSKLDNEVKVLHGGNFSDKGGYFIEPFIVQTTNPKYVTMEEEIFGPFLTICTYPDEEWEGMMKIAAETSPYALTCAIFGTDFEFIQKASSILRYSAGNLYINDKCTAAVVGQQPFGGSRKSGTNDKAGSILNLLRWTSPRCIKENYTTLNHWSYPSNE